MAILTRKEMVKIHTKSIQECLVCRKKIKIGQRMVEAKARVSGEWLKAHLSCAKDCPGEHPLIRPRMIRSATTKKRIMPNKKPLDWSLTIIE